MRDFLALSRILLLLLAVSLLILPAALALPLDRANGPPVSVVLDQIFVIAVPSVSTATVVTFHFLPPPTEPVAFSAIGKPANMGTVTTLLKFPSEQWAVQNKSGFEFVVSRQR